MQYVYKTIVHQLLNRDIESNNHLSKLSILYIENRNRKTKIVVATRFVQKNTIFYLFRLIRITVCQRPHFPKNNENWENIFISIWILTTEI